MVINHAAGVYVEGNVHTNTIEGFFGNLKTGMRGAYKHVSSKWLQSYLDEWAWRHNAKRTGLPKDAFGKLKQAYLDQGGQRENAAYGWVRADV